MALATLHNETGIRIGAAAEAISEHLVAVRRNIHAHPELGFQERRTAGIVTAELQRLGIVQRSEVGGTGVLGVIDGGRPGPTLAIRADLDALPIQEQTGLDYASQAEGRMHACGHDIHTATLLGAAAVLRDLAPQLAGRILLVFQPAEELLLGAAAMLADMDAAGERFDMALGFHNAPHLPVGRFSYAHGASLAAADLFDLLIEGRSGHAAHPSGAIDPIVAAAHFVSQAQTVVSREVRPLHPAVVTIGMLQGGTTYNIIPDSVALKGTVRTLHAAARDTAEAALRRLAEGIEHGLRVRCRLDYRRVVPALMNDEAMLQRSVAALRAQFGAVVDRAEPSMGAEDFALFAQRAPAFHLRVGSGAPGRHDALHNSDYQPDEGCIGLGVQALSRMALDLLTPDLLTPEQPAPQRAD